uniref:Charged multivesicular body protein 6 n=1 Tax=Dictyostelium discoideum TaxID=44689 RepID=CHMP6_DICDI|nr:RecName: Full=Charged multivesicular body protein 6; AltName: Full=Vacuolar protein-sorting-associated protein 20 [Dictyostelium discoideum]
MGILFSHCSGGREKEDKISKTDRAVLNLKIQRDKLKNYQTQVLEIAIAKECSKAGKKNQALLALKKKKYQEKMLDESFANLQNIEELIANVEQAEIQVRIFESLKQGNESLKEIQKEMSLEDVENLMEETAEAIQYQNDISEALSGKFSKEEEDDLLNELDEMEKQLNAQQYPKVPETQLPKIELPIEDAIEEGKQRKSTTNGLNHILIIACIINHIF